MNKNQYRCFNLPDINQPKIPTKFEQWWKFYGQQQLSLSSKHQEYLAKLMPILLCGEQSAICIFDNEINRLKSSYVNLALGDLQSVLEDEYYHDKLLDHIVSQLPKLSETYKIKNLAKRFYAKLGNENSLANHFSLISQLDSCVCIIFNFIEHSDLKNNEMIINLFKMIKQDEARHVSISKHHALMLNTPINNDRITHDLTNLLSTQSDVFEGLGIDFDLMKSRILKMKG